MLKSFIDWDIHYSNQYKDYTDTLSWEETTLDKLEKWDVFILVKDCEKLERIEKHKFNILIQYTQWVYVIQFLDDYYWVEVIKNWHYSWDDTKIYKFNRF